MAIYSIKDLEKLSGIKAHTLRMWEKRYGILDPGRTDTNIRTYSDSDLKKILNVSILNRYGIKISRIADMEENEIAEKILLLIQDSTDQKSLIENLIVSMVEMDGDSFEKMISRAIMQNGFEETVYRIIYPLFEKIGILWQTGAVNPAQEHYITNLIRQKMIVAIDSIQTESIENPKHFLLFLPEGELHELGLLFYSYLIQKRGHQVTYLGQWVPLEDMASASTVVDYDYLLTSIVSVHAGKDLEKYLESLSNSFANTKIFISGYQTEFINKELPSNIISLTKAKDILEYL